MILQSAIARVAKSLRDLKPQRYAAMGLLAAVTLVISSSSSSADDWGRRSGFRGGYGYQGYGYQGYRGGYAAPVTRFYAPGAYYGSYYRGYVPGNYGAYYGNAYRNQLYGPGLGGTGYYPNGYNPSGMFTNPPRIPFNPIYGRGLPW